METTLLIKRNVIFLMVLFVGLVLSCSTDAHAEVYYWRGTSTDWNSTSNWRIKTAGVEVAPVILPGINDDVVIGDESMASTAPQPRVFAWVDISVKSLTIGTGEYPASLFMSCNTFQIKGNVLIGKNGSYENNGTRAIYNGDFIVEAGGIFKESAYTENNGRGSLDNKYWPVSVFENSEGRVQTITFPIATPSGTGFNWLEINNALTLSSNVNMVTTNCYKRQDNTVIQVRPPSLTVRGTLDPATFKLNFATGHSFEVLDGGTTYVRATNFEGNYTNELSSAAAYPTLLTTYSTVDYLRTGDQIVASLMYGNLKLSDSGSKVLAAGTVGIANSLNIGTGVIIDPLTNKPIVNYNGPIAQTVRRLNYHHLTLSRAGTKTFETGETKIAGNFEVTATAPVYTDNTTIHFNGVGAQQVAAINYDNLLFTVRGIKTLQGSSSILNVKKLLKLEVASGGVVTYSDNYIDLITGARKIVLNTAGDAMIESATAFVTGTVETTKSLVAEHGRSFAGMGITITPTSGTPGTTKITRVTGTPVGTAGRSIKRSFVVEPVSNNANLGATVKIDYFDHELNGLAKEALSGYYSELYWPTTDWKIYYGSTNNHQGSLPENSVTFNGIQRLGRYTAGGDPSIFPVELISFTAIRSGKDAVLNWAVASEQNNAGFEVEVSADGRSFERIGFVKSRVGTSSARQEYSFTDTRIGKSGIVYYRIKQLDLNGANKIYEPKDVVFGNIDKAIIAAYPNPVERQLNLTISLPFADNATIILHDVMGEVLFRKEKSLEAGTSIHDLSIFENLRAGVYLLIIKLSDQVQTIRLVKK